MNVLYFAWLRTKIGKGTDTLDTTTIPVDIITALDVVEYLRTQGDNYADAFDNLKGIRVAINQDFAKFDSPVKQGDEVAFFPPVTGG